MLSKFSRFLTIAALTTLTCVITHPSSAQPETSEMGEEIEIVTVPLTINQLVNEAFWENSGDFFEQASMGGQLNTIFGWRKFPQGSYPENNITEDGLLLYAILSDYFRQLQEREPIIRTRDLANPFDTSLRENPQYQ
ncbi:hypothetical protein WEU38_00175 [Cyanobacterium aponinum AL20118]|uniref:Uncharacterized protein n=3 Tax=Cyanobacterium aponinum TaxID=379064 RepID=K9YZ68_CYAAP|nr:hypothetical protein [Cyanobacterium aponinum]AFZ52194.1 hypothetical protein Cyan10605_0033 [Cyanobacterium aponinum PCC 10605]MBD2392857.1 hypothetical protein [Cyanobacterium aponinum FACHB-4101]MTF38158.1 hypothetical protein [Cyanobacterium aponinum 0216]PHV63940.1 hypothetical protein CSQ80_02630 [Cyanobacterium aponinum IPPAS B-1201]WPF88729.1 hypothetical protein SAY89_00180 [Cyanobacterium aponinum AL20115]